MAEPTQPWPSAPAPQFARAYPILYVDDEIDNLIVFRATLRDEFEVLTAASAQEALEILGQRQISVLLTDQRMPAMTGVDLCERVRDLWPSVQRMLITAYSDRDVAIAAINRGGVSRYITKPWDADQLRQLLREAVARAHLERMVRRLRQSILDKERLVGAHAANARLLQELAHTNASVGVCCERLENLAPRLAGELDAETWSRYRADVNELRHYVDHVRALQQRSTVDPTVIARPQRSLINVGALLDTVLELVRNDIDGVARVSVHCPADAGLWSDATDTSRMLILLVRSAATAMRDDNLRGCAISIDVTPEGGSTIIQVRDNGTPLGLLRQRAVLAGTLEHARGQGLDAAAALAVVNGGQLDAVTSEDEAWTSWQLTLPAVEPRGPDKAE